MPSSIPPGTDLSQIPALAPPSGVTPNFVDPESRAHSVLITNGIITAIMLVFVILRVYARTFVTKSFGWDDASCIAGSIIAVGYVGLVAHVFHTGIGAHQWNVHVTVFLKDTTIKELKATNYLYGPMMIFAKLSILLLYFRLFSPSKSVRIWIYGGIVTTLLNHVIGTILAITLCTPSDPLGYSHCSHRLDVLDIVISVINIISDFYVLLLPLFVISNLQMRRNKKIAVGAVFCTGLLACVSSITGLVYRIVEWHSDDTSWWLGPLLILSLLEIDIGLIVGCMPILPAIFQHEKGGFKFSAGPLSSLRSRFLGFCNSHTKHSSVSSNAKEVHLTMPSEEDGLRGTRRQYVELGSVEHKRPRPEPSFEHPKFEPSSVV